jgi:hypothetical protein
MNSFEMKTATAVKFIADRKKHYFRSRKAQGRQRLSPILSGKELRDEVMWMVG